MRGGAATLNHLLEPIAHHLRDPRTTEVVIQKEHEVGVEQDGKWSWHHVPSFTERRLDAMGIVASQLLSKPFGPAHPMCTTFLPSGERYTTCRPPVTPDGIAVSIRVPTRGMVCDDGDEYVDLEAAA